ncbi:MAG: nuclear transport factor 2 family protein [Novosphingobium sp.]|nr:nuclear transport factor 2 family protein [Novosphingobium sp.]
MNETNRRGALAAAALATGMAAAATSAEAGTKKHAHNLAEQVDALASRAAIEEVLLDYARGNDHADEEMIRSCFWPESAHKHGGYEGTSMDFVDFAMKILVKLKYCEHRITNISVRVDGDRGFSECYYLAHHRRDNKAGTGEEDAFFEGRYIDILERRDGVWKIIHRRGMSDWNSPVFPAESPYSELPAGTHALRSKDDPYYKMLALFEAGS